MPKHSFSLQPSALHLFEGTQTIEEFCRKLIKLSETLPQTDPLRWGTSKDPHEDINCVLGEGFELFSELLVLFLGANPKIGLTDYEPVEEDDEGVDAYAKNLKLKTSAVQCKFRADPTFKFTRSNSNIANFLVEAMFNGVHWEAEQTPKLMYLITTSAGLNEYTAKKWHHCVKVINRETIASLVDGNEIFWNSCVAKIKENQVVPISN